MNSKNLSAARAKQILSTATQSRVLIVGIFGLTVLQFIDNLAKI